MRTQKKVVLIVILGVGASLLIFLLGNYFSQKYRHNQHLLAVIQQMTNRIGNIHLLSMDFIQSGDPKAWQALTSNLVALRRNIAKKNPFTGPEADILPALGEELSHYEQLLSRIHDPAIQLNREKVRLQQMGLSFATEVRERIIIPYRKEEGLRIYQGQEVDPIKVRIKDTAYDLMGLHTEQQLLLTELLLDWDIAKYRQKKAVISKAMGQHKNQLNYLSILMGKAQDIISSLEEKMSLLLSSEQKILNHFSKLEQLNHESAIVEERLTALCSEFSSQTRSAISRSDRLNRILSWGVLLTILCSLVLLGFMLARDIIGILEDLRITQSSFDHANIGIYRIGPDGQILKVNEKAANFLGYTRQELEALTLMDIDPQVTPESWPLIWREIQDTGQFYYDREHLRKDGSRMPVEIYTGRMEYQDQQYSIAFVQDITERKQMELALKESEERLDLALEGANEGIWDLNLVEDVFYLDSRYYTIAGYEPNAFEGTFTEIYKRVHPDNLKQVQFSFSRSIAGELESFEAPFRFLRKDGNYMWIMSKGKIVDRDAQGKPTRIIGTNADISEFKKVEKALQESKARLDEANSLAGLGYWEWHVNTGEVNWSDRVYEIFGLAPAEFTPTIESVMSLSPWPECSKRNEEIMQQLIEKNDTGEFDQKFLRPDDTTGYYYSTFKGKYDTDGKLTIIQGTVIDITERKQRESEMRSLRNYLSNIINSMPSMLVGVDAQGMVTLWNQEAEKLTGRSADTVVGTPMVEAIPQLSREMERVRLAIKTGQEQTDPKRKRRKNGDLFYEDLTIFPLVANGVEGAVIRVDDITDQVRMEEMMIQSEKMLTVGGLAAGMAHEINNPLASMLQTANVMQNRLNGRLDIPANRKAAEKAGITLEGLEQFMAARSIPRMLETIVTSGKRVAEIVGNMLSFARKGNEGMVLGRLDEIVESTLALAATDYNLKKEYDFKKIIIVREYARDLPPALCEEAKIQQVLLNILGNGAQAMQAAAIEAPCFIIRIFVDKRRHMICLEIADNGPGIDEATRKKVFDPFFTTKPIGQGTGLGLSVSYFIITENHGGEMVVESEPGAGAKFIIRLPLRENKPNIGK
nr:PAS domain S-box protein [uncultured Desulfobacter sp.]